MKGKKSYLTDEMGLTTGKIPPQATDVERSILGAILMNKNALLAVQDDLTPESFFEPANQIIFAAVKKLWRESKPIDITTVVVALRNAGELESVGGAFYLTSLTNNMVSLVNVPYYTVIVREKHMKRELIRIGGELVQKSFDEGIDVFESISSVQKDIIEITNKGSKQEKTSESVMKSTLKRMEKAANAPLGLIGHSTGLSEVDRLSGGLMGANLIVIAGRPGMGKTVLAIQFARYLSVYLKIPTAIFSLEMSNEELMERHLAQESGLPYQGIKRGQFFGDKKFDDAVDRLARGQMIFESETSINIFQLKARVAMYKIKYNVGMVVIDYLQLMKGSDKRMQKLDVLEEITREAKVMAKELDIPVILVSQLSREVEKRPDKTPQLGDLRGSGTIEQDADIVIFPFRPHYYNKDENPEYAELIFAKFRGGNPFKVPVTWLGDFQVFKDA